MLSDRIYYSACAGLCVLMIALALVWPQGEGRRSPGIFGHPEVVPNAFQAKKHREATKARQAAPLRPAINAKGFKS